MTNDSCADPSVVSNDGMGASSGPATGTRGPRQSRRAAYARTASTTDERRPRAFFDRHLCAVTHPSIGIITSRSRSRSLLERALEPSLLDVDEHFLVHPTVDERLERPRPRTAHRQVVLRAPPVATLGIWRARSRGRRECDDATR